MGNPLYFFKSLLRNILPSFIIDWYHFGLAWFAALTYRFPGKKMSRPPGASPTGFPIKVIAVTGTNGKSTVVEMLSRILEEEGLKVASLSSIRFRISGREEANDKRMTMPGRSFVQGFLKRAKDQGCSHVLLEVTSEGIKQHRHEFIDFDTAIFTNLSPEHIESHGSFEKYRSAKGQLFKAAKNIHVLNLDDENIEFFLQFPSKDKWGYGIKTKSSSKTSHFTAGEDVEVSADGSSFAVGGTWFNIKLLGEFNVYNAISAITAAQSQGISLGTCKKALERMEGMPGRMEEVVRNPFRVLVDYAFTPNAIQKVYETISQKIKSPDPNAKMICVLGCCGGGRDKWKRPVLGEIASRFCHQMILTNEDPYDEDPMAIVEDVRKGIPDLSYEMFAARIILDRRIAIAKALSSARPGDVVVVTGKGCEPSICLAHGQRIPWDDRRVVREEMEKLMANKPAPDELSRPAGITVRVEGRTQAELFFNASRAMTEILKPETARKNGMNCAVQVSSPDAPTLLADFLNQVLYLIQTNREVYPKIEFEQIGEQEVRSTMMGRKVKALGGEIKAVARRDLRVSQKDGLWEATVSFDIRR